MNNQNTKETLPPQNIEAEQSVLGSLLIDKDAIVKIADFLTPDDFYKDTHKIIFSAMLDLYEPRIPDNWLDRIVFGPTGTVRDRFARRLPDEVEHDMLAYVRAKQRVYQLSGKRLLVMALPRNDRR